jgi:hypothetical protein
MKKAFGIIVSIALSCLLSVTLTHAQRKNSPPAEFLPAPVSVVRLNNDTRTSVSKFSPQRLDVAGRFLQVENIAEKTIRYVRIDFYDALAFQAPVTLVYGQMNSGLNAKKWELKPGGRVFLSIEKNAQPQRGQTFQQIAERLASSRGHSEISVVVFTDGTAWLEGMLHRQDPHDSSRWNVIKQQSASPNLSTVSGLIEPVSFSPISFKAATPSYQQCYRYLGFTNIDCCGLTQVHHLLEPDPFGNWEPVFFNVQCDGGGSCEWQKRVICGQGDGD